MKFRDPTDCLLICGAIVLTIFTLGQVGLLTWGVVDSARNWQRGVRLDTSSQWLQVPLGALFIFILLGINAAVWRRVVSRRRLLDGADPNAAALLDPRSKYAVWSLVPPKNSRNALPTRKKIGRL